MHYTITGGAGFIGSHFARRLREQNHTVTILDNLVTGYRENIPFGTAFFNIDLRNDYQVYPDIVRHFEYNPPDVVVALAALPRIQPSFEQPGVTLVNNNGCTVQALEIARKYGARVLYAGSSTAYDDPSSSPYSLSKYHGEQMCAAYRDIYGMAISVVRFHNVYGGGDSIGPWATVIEIFKRQYQQGLPLTVVSPGTQVRCFTAIDDILDGLQATLAAPLQKEPLSLGSRTLYSLLDIVRIFDHPHILVPERRGDASVILSEYEDTYNRIRWQATRSLCKYIEDFKAEADAEKILKKYNAAY